jgi:hypothetical protein
LRIRILVRLRRRKKLDFDMKNTYVQKPFWKAGNHVCLLIFVKFLAPWSGSAFPMWIRIRNSDKKWLIDG